MMYFDRMENSSEEIEITIKMRCTKHYVPEFIAMLKRMEVDGEVGHSEWLAIYADGDGSMRPKFAIKAPLDVLKAAKNPRVQKRSITCPCYDAG